MAGDQRIELNKNKAGLLLVLNPDNNYDNDSNFLLIAKGNEYVKASKYINVLYDRLDELLDERLDDDETVEDLIDDHVTFFTDEYDLEIVSRKRIIAAANGVTPSTPVEGYTKLTVDCPGEEPRIQGIPSKVFNLQLATKGKTKDADKLYGLIVLMEEAVKEESIFLITKNIKHIDTMYKRIEEIKEDPVGNDSESPAELVHDHLVFFIQKFLLKSIDMADVIEIPKVELDGYRLVKVKDTDNDNNPMVIPTRVIKMK